MQTLNRKKIKVDLLTAAEEKRLVRKAKRGDVEAMNRLVLANMGFVWKKAIYWSHRFSHVSDEDFAQIGVLCIYHCLSRFELKHGLRLMTYCGQAMDNLMIKHGMETSGPLRVSCRADRLRPLSVEISEAVSTRHEMSAPARDLGAEIDADERLLKLRASIDGLDPRHAEIIRGRMAGETLETIGDRLGLSKERVRQLETKAKLAIKAMMRA